MDFHISEKIWESKTMYYETVGFRYDKNGNVVSGQLLYEPDKIFGVYSWDWQTPFTEGVDYAMDGRRILWLPGSAIQVYPYDRNLPPYAEGEEPGFGVTWFDKTRHVSIDPEAYQFQVAVVYSHHGEWAGKVPKSERDKLPKTFEKLRMGKSLNVVYFGDSIAAGREASGQDEEVLGARYGEVPGTFIQREIHLVINREPHLPSFARLMSNSLQNAYPQAKINHINRSAPAHNTFWALWACEDTVNIRKPDLCVLAFGMNSADRSVDEFRDHIKRLIEMISAKNPECEFILMSTHEPNRDAEIYLHHVLMEQEEQLYSLQQEMKQNIAVAPVHSTFRTMYDMGKSFGDLTGNNINHPNDFSIIVYAQILDAVLGL